MITKTQERPTSAPQATKEIPSHGDPSLLSSKTGSKTKLIVRFDAGFGNTLHLRGKGTNLSWDKSILLKNISPDTWIWETEAPFKTIEFKVLLNDRLWELGENHVIQCGSTIEFRPRF